MGIFTGRDDSLDREAEKERMARKADLVLLRTKIQVQPGPICTYQIDEYGTMARGYSGTNTYEAIKQFADYLYAKGYR